MITKEFLREVVKKEWKCTKHKCGKKAVGVKFVLTMKLETSRLQVFSRCDRHLDPDCVTMDELHELLGETPHDSKPTGFRNDGHFDA